MRTRKRGPALLLIFAIALSWAPPARAQVPQETVEAAYLAKFGRYIVWPASARARGRDEIQLCVVGTDPFGSTIDRAAAGERIGGRPISVRRISSAAGAAGCHIAFVQGTDGDETRSLLHAMRALPVVTVTSARAGSARGIIHFVVRDGRIRFYIDNAEAGERGLSISSRLLALAIAVRRRGS